MQILSLSGSSRHGSSNTRLLKAIELQFPAHQFLIWNEIHDLPLFRPDKDAYPWPSTVSVWREKVKAADVVIISTPEYLHNVPAALKNALEWLSSSGELMHKRVLPISFTPHPPRGEKAMQSLTWTLQALKANIMTQLPLYQSEIGFDSNGNILNKEIQEMLTEILSLIG